MSKSEQLSLREILPMLEQKGVVELYRKIVKDVDLTKFYFKPNGIHGVLHAQRVLILALILSDLNEFSTSDRNLLIQAALFHDIGRQNDYLCYQHGIDSVKKMQEYKLFSPDLTQEETQILIFIIENHCINDEKALSNMSKYNIMDKNRAIILFYTFKDCDALDRCRIGDLDISYLRNKQALLLPNLAEELLAQGAHLLESKNPK